MEEEDIYFTEASCSFGVNTNESPIEIVTEELEIKPDRSWNKGDMHYSKTTGNTNPLPFGLWVIEKETISSDKFILSEFVKHFQDILSDKFDAIEKLKNHYKFDCYFYVLILSEYGADGFDLSDSELQFISKISNRFTCRFCETDRVRRKE